MAVAVAVAAETVEAAAALAPLVVEERAASTTNQWYEEWCLYSVVVVPGVSKPR